MTLEDEACDEALANRLRDIGAVQTRDHGDGETLEWVNAPLEVVLDEVAGYLAASRREPSAPEKLKRFDPEFRATLIEFAAARIQDVWNDVGETDAQTLAENVVKAQEWAWMSAQVPVQGDAKLLQNSEPSDTDERTVLMTHPHDGHGPNDTCLDCIESDTNQREWEYGFYDSDGDPGSPSIYWFCFGLPFLTAEQAKHTGDKNVWGRTIVVRHEKGSSLDSWEVVPDAE